MHRAKERKKGKGKGMERKGGESEENSKGLRERVRHRGK